MKVRVHIAELVLDGFDLAGHEAPRIEAAVRAELTRMLQAGALADPAMLRSTDCVSVRMDRPHRAPERLGAQVAGATLGSLTS